MRARLAWCAGWLGGAALCTAAACSNGPPPPTGSGNKVYVDVDASSQGPPPADDGGGVFARVEGGYGAGDGYVSSPAFCKTCACPAATEYCYGGAPGEVFSGDCNPTTFAAGCQPLADTTCAAGDCDCLNDYVRGLGVGCYPDCTLKPTIVYCP